MNSNPFFQAIWLQNIKLDDVVFGSGCCFLYELISHFCWQYAQMQTSVNTWYGDSLCSADGLSCTLLGFLCEGFISLLETSLT